MQVYSKLTLAVKNKTAKLRIYGDIVEETAMSVVSQLDALPSTVTEIKVHINSFGGSVSAGLAIYNSLKQHPAKKTVCIDGVAMSIATVIAMAGTEIQIPEAALFMVHAPWSSAQGNAVEMRKSASALDQFAAAMLAAYASRVSEDFIKPLITDGLDHYFTGSEAVSMGLCDLLIKDEGNNAILASVSAANTNPVLAAFTRGLAAFEESMDQETSPEAVEVSVDDVVDAVEAPVAEAPVAVEAKVDVEAMLRAVKEDAEAKAAAAVAEAHAKLFEVEARLAKEVEAREVEASVKAAEKDFANLPGKALDVGPAMRSLAKADPKAYEVIRTLMLQTDALLANAKVAVQLAPIGVSASSEESEGPEAKVERLSRQKMAANKSLSIYAARTLVYQEHPSLYAAIRGKE